MVESYRAKRLYGGQREPPVEVNGYRAKPFNELKKSEARVAELEASKSLLLASEVANQMNAERLKYEAQLRGCDKTIKELMATRKKLEAENKSLRESLGSAYAHHRCPDCPGRGSHIEIVGLPRLKPQ